MLYHFKNIRYIWHYDIIDVIVIAEHFTELLKLFQTSLLSLSFHIFIGIVESFSAKLQFFK